MKNLFFLLSVVLFTCTSTLAQVSGKFYIDKELFSPGEEIIVHFKVTNSGNETLMLNVTGLPDAPFCAGYTLKLLSQPKTAPPARNVAIRNTCVLNGQLHYRTIAPGETYIQNIRLNMYFDPVTPGNYSIEVQHYSLRRNGADSPDHLDVQAQLHFQIK
jgi:hypothetical protein